MLSLHRKMRSVQTSIVPDGVLIDTFRSAQNHYSQHEIKTDLIDFINMFYWVANKMGSECSCMLTLKITLSLTRDIFH